MTILKLNLFPIISKVIVACVVLHYIAFEKKTMADVDVGIAGN